MMQQVAEDRMRYLFRKTEAWLYSYPAWKRWLNEEYGQDAYRYSHMPPLRRTVKPTEAISVSRAELSRRVDKMTVVYNLLSPKERKLVKLYYWTENEDSTIGMSLTEIAKIIGVHRNTVSSMRQRVVEEFRRGLFGV